MSRASDCIRKAVEEGRISRAKGEEIANLLDEAENIRAQRGQGTDAIKEVAPTLRDQLEERHALRKRQAIDQATIQQELFDMIQGLEFQDAKRAALSLMAPDYLGGFSPNSIETLKKVHLGVMEGLMVDFIDRFRSKAAGFRREKAGLRPVARELMGEDSGDEAAKRLAGAVRKALDYEYNTKQRLGAQVGFLENYTPVRHNAQSIRSVPKDEWVSEVKQRFRLREDVDPDTLEPLTDQRVTEIFEEIYDDIAFGRTSKADGKPSLIKKLERERRLTPRSADDYLTYIEKYGDGDFWNTMVSHFQNAAVDIATLETLGPQPQATVRFLSRELDNKAKQVGERFPVNRNALDNNFEYQTGVVNMTTGGRSERWGKGVEAARSIITSSVLSGAGLTIALVDPAFRAMVRSFNNLPHGNFARSAVALTLREGTQREAVRLGLTAQGMTSMASAAHRLMGQFSGPKFSRLIADRSLRLGMLGPLTDAGRWGMGTEFLGFFTDQRGVKFQNLPRMMRENLARNNIGEKDWDLFRQGITRADEETGVEYLQPIDMILEGGARAEAAKKFQSFIFKELDAAVPLVSGRVQASLLQGTRPDTFLGSMIRFATIAKSFPMSMQYMQWQRFWSMDKVSDRGKYVAQLLFMTTMMGAATEQANQVTQGKKPRDWNDGDLWVNALWRSGGLGIMSDFLFTNLSNNSSLADTMLGPGVAAADRFSQLTLGNALEAAQGEEMNVGRDALKFLDLTIPGNRLFYGRLAIERLIMDEAQKMVDPRAFESFAAIERGAKSRDEEFFFPPGTGVDRLRELID